MKGGSRNLGKKFPDRKKPDVEKTKARRDEAAEEALWRHVILQAIDDATTPLTKSQMNKPRAVLDCQRAREWLLGNSQRFRLACECAGVEIGRVRTLARQLIEQADARQRAVMNDIKAMAMNAFAKQQQQTAEFLTSTMPGVGKDFQMEGEDRRTSFARDGEKIEFSMHVYNIAQNQSLSAESSGETVKEDVKS